MVRAEPRVNMAQVYFALERPDPAKPWTNAAFGKYREFAPDCTDAWLVYWRQNMPGLDNQQKDNFGRPMKNWWPFLFY